MSFPTEEITKHEVYRSIRTLQYQFKKLNNIDFVCDGASILVKVIIAVLDRIITRFPQYKQNYTRLPLLLRTLQLWCNHLYDSKTSEIPWSVLPSLETHFSKIIPKSKFIIAPTWERNYAIHTISTLKSLIDYTGNIEGLIAESIDEASSFYKDLLKDEKDCDDIFIILYPRVKRLSALHFSILGHEIGHLIYEKWQKEGFLEKFFDKNKIIQQLEKNIDTRIEQEKVSNEQIGMFTELFRAELIKSQITSIKNCLKELCCDIAGSIIFNYSFTLALYKFSSLEDAYDEYIEYGYYPWSFRVKTSIKTIKTISNPSLDTIEPIENWIKDLDNKFTKEDSIQKIIESRNNNYHEIFIKAFEDSFEDIVRQIENYITPNDFYNDFNKSSVDFVKDYLDKSIIPAASIDSSLTNIPVSMRNIITGTWYHIISSIDNKSDTYNFYRKTLKANLLALKAIELSKILEDFQKKQ